MAVRIGIVAERDGVGVLQADKAGHRINTGAVHANLAIVIDRHEGEGRIDGLVHHGQIQLVRRRDALPVIHTGAAERIDAQLQPGRLDRVHVDDRVQVVHIGLDEILLVGGVRPQRRRVGQPAHLGIVRSQQGVGAILNPAGGVGVGRSAVGRVVLETAIARWIVRRRDDDAIRPPALPPAIVNEDGPRDDRRRRIAFVFLNDRLDAIRG